jgi:3-oxoacyl-[acyl-carrier-protein] synthase III
MSENKYNAAITAVGMYVPEKILDNAYFEKIVDTTDQWITSRTGIKERRVLENGATSLLATKAAEDLLLNHNISPEEIDVIIVATVTPICFFLQLHVLYRIISVQKCMGI